MLPVSLDYALAMADGVGGRGGLSEPELEAETTAFARAQRRIVEEVAAGRLGFFGLPKERGTLAEIETYVAGLDEDIEHVVLLGIGGSSLGPRALLVALGGPPDLGPLPSGRRIHLPDNSDPWLLSRLLAKLPPARTLAIAVSKSGGTVETAAQLLIVRAWLAEALGAEKAKGHFAVITDPNKGPLRELAERDGLRAFPIPANVGGRFSVLSAVGLVPAVLAGFDGQALLDGAEQMATAARRTDLRENPAGMLAVLHAGHHRLRGHGIHVLMPYADALRPFASWYVQLWAESLGKRFDRQSRLVETGPTPLPAIGATDQHAQAQLFMEGPRDKLLTFVQVAEGDADVAIPSVPGAFDYLGGKKLSELLDAERRGTALALAADGRPSLTLRIERVDERSMGALFFLYEAATAFAGELYGVDAFDQPGVEAGKRLAFGLLGREGYLEAAEDARKAEAGLPTRYRIR